MHNEFRQVDVFTDTPYLGNPVAVVLGADGLSAEQMQLFARWTNLSETTFVLAPRAGEADYLVRIFTPTGELPFAGHPTLGTCHAWLEAGGRPASPGAIVQECQAGLVTVRQRRSGPGVRGPAAGAQRAGGGPSDRTGDARVGHQAGRHRGYRLGRQRAWLGRRAAGQRRGGAGLRPGTVDMDIGVAGPYPDGSPEAIEVRAFSPKVTSVEDPVTGSLNASLGQWLLAAGRVTSPYVASQGTVMGRRGRVHVSCDGDGQVWVGGGTVTCISGTVEL